MLPVPALHAACLPACLPACLRACVPACLPACQQRDQQRTTAQQQQHHKQQHDTTVRRRARRKSHHQLEIGREPSVAEAVIATAGKEDAQFYDLNITFSDQYSSDEQTASDGGESSSSSRRMDSVKACFGKYGGLILAMLMCQVGMILFNLGLTYGFAGGEALTAAACPMFSEA
jgi:hypothetical protein